MVESKFKNTDIGQIPEDWDLVRWNDVFDFKSTASYSRAEIKSSGDIGYIHYGDIHTKITATLDVNKFVSGYISNKQLKTYTSIKEGDLIMADASEDLSGVGKSFEVKNPPKTPVISGLHTFLIREKKNSIIAKGFKGYFHFNPLIKKQYDSLATGLKVYSLSKGSFQHIQVPLPPFEEQKAIAKVLSETDAWIRSLENLIIKKRNIKNGALQSLLTPRENWVLYKLEELCEYRNGKSFENKITLNGKYKLITLNSIDIKGKLKKEHHRIDEQDSSLKNGDVVMVLSDVAHGNFLGLSALIPDNNFVLNQRMGALQNIKKINSALLVFIINFNQPYFKLSGKGSSQLNLGKNDILSFEFKAPKSTEEQTEIVTILSDMDFEIDNLEIKLAKAKELKQGIMQQLLTGKMRLVNILQTS